MSVRAIAVEGGPGGGKTTGIVRMYHALQRAGFYPLVVPEVPTILITGGISPGAISGVDFQRSVIRLQLALEREWRLHAENLSKETGKIVVLLFDRGLVSPVAYIESPDPFSFATELFAEVGFHSIEEVYRQYDAVIHMVTAADGALPHYTLLNNAARTESPELARIRDGRTKQAWLAHSHFVEVSNVTPLGEIRTFDEKLRYAIDALLQVLGEPPLEIEQKFLLNTFDPAALPVPYEKISIEQTYLSHAVPNVTERVRMRTWRGGVSFVHTTKELARAGGRYESERFVGVDEFHALMTRADPKRVTLHKTRYLFLWKGQRFELDVFEGKDEIFLEREKVKDAEETVLPDFLNIAREVTDDPHYSNHAMALKNRA